MKSSIYISSEKIEVIGYSKFGRKVSLKEHISVPLNEGTMMNGKITDSAHLEERLAELRAHKRGLFRKAVLIVDGSSILTKRIIAPKLKDRQYEQLIRDDFADSAGSFAELVCDYRLTDGVAGEASKALLACATDKLQIDGYVSAFKNVGVKLKSIRIGVQALLEYLKKRSDLQQSTFVLNVIDGVAMLSMIFENGVNVFMTRTRLYSENREQMLQGILERLSSLIQFNRSEKFNDITHSYYLGLGKDDLKSLAAVNPHHDVKIDTLDICGDIQNIISPLPGAHFAYLNTFLSDDCIDLIESCEKLEKYKKRQRPKKYWIPALVLVILMLAAPVVWLNRRIMDLEIQIDAVNVYLTDTEVESKSRGLDEIMEETAYYNSVQDQMNSRLADENKRLPVSSRILDLITKTYSSKVTIVQVDFNGATGIFQVTGRSTTESDSAEYVEALKRDSDIKDIVYTGYSYNSRGEYNFSVDVILAVREVAE